jgi:ADP-heptose:LPS heptosyltransferase
VTLLGLAGARWFADRRADLVDDLMVVEGVAGLDEVEPDAAVALRFLAAAQARRFDLALQLHGSGVTTNPLTTLLGARHQVTARLPGEWVPPGTVIAYPGGPEVRRTLAVAEAAGCPPAGEDIDLPVTAAERADARALAGTGPYACLHPGASRPDNRWPAPRFAALADRLASAGVQVVLTGTDGERDAVTAVTAAMTAPAVDLCGRTSVGLLAALFAASDLVVSNDTGAAHVAAAVRVPSVVVFPADGDPERWAPLDRARHVSVLPRPGAHDRWPAVDAVVGAASGALGRSLAPRRLQEAR